ncbi:hypothetical protein FRC17_006783 [Serendipita sp. 399]|nr:hypothetical protein FRC17_006783 [Serendipita sp. 399]
MTHSEIYQIINRVTLSAYVPFDIVLGVLYIIIAIIEGFGVTAAIMSRLPLVKIYAYLSVVGVLAVVAIEVIRLVLHNVFKKAILDQCVKEVTGLTLTTTTGSFFNPSTSSTTVDPAQAQKLCNDWWVKAIWKDVGWIMIALVFGIIFALVNIAFYRQLADPSLLRTQAPSAAYRLHAMRYSHNQRYNDEQNIPGYNPYATQSYGGNYVPAYDARNNAYNAPPGEVDNKPPGYTSAPGYEAFGAGDEKAGYTGGGETNNRSNANPFSDPTPGYVPPAGPPPGLGGHERLGGGAAAADRDEGFDPKMLEAVMKASEVETRGNNARAGTNGEGSGAALR